MKEKYVEATVVVEAFEEDIVTDSQCNNKNFKGQEKCQGGGAFHT